MFIVYLIQSTSYPDKKYIGFTTNLDKRLLEHNSGKTPFTKNNGPWKVKVVVQFQEEKRAKEFEAYLKHGSGYAFAKRHFW